MLTGYDSQLKKLHTKYTAYWNLSKVAYPFLRLGIQSNWQTHQTLIDCDISSTRRGILT